MNSRRYWWNGHIVYLAPVGGKWTVVYDGPCGKERSYLLAEELYPTDDGREARRRLDAWARKNGLERVAAV